MNTLFDLDSVPVVEKESPPKKTATRYYLRVRAAGGWRFLWKTHSNGGCEWCSELELTTHGGRKKPLFYKTLSGASRMLAAYTGMKTEAGVAVWEENK